jgi:hypothetical protein
LSPRLTNKLDTAWLNHKVTQTAHPLPTQDFHHIGYILGVQVEFW